MLRSLQILPQKLQGQGLPPKQAGVGGSAGSGGEGVLEQVLLDVACTALGLQALSAVRALALGLDPVTVNILMSLIRRLVFEQVLLDVARTALGLQAQAAVRGFGLGLNPVIVNILMSLIRRLVLEQVLLDVARTALGLQALTAVRGPPLDLDLDVVESESSLYPRRLCGHWSGADLLCSTFGHGSAAFSGC